MTSHTPDRGQIAWEMRLLTCEMSWQLTDCTAQPETRRTYERGLFLHCCIFTFSDGGLMGRKSVLGLATVGPPAKTEELEMRISGLGQAAGA